MAIRASVSGRSQRSMVLARRNRVCQASILAVNRILARRALLGSGWAENVLLVVREGRIAEVAVGSPPASPADLVAGIVIPGLANSHSHAFQRALAGRTEHRSAAGRDSFWTWRERMYELTGRLDAGTLAAIARQAYAEMLASRLHVGRRVPLPVPGPHGGAATATSCSRRSARGGARKRHSADLCPGALRTCGVRPSRARSEAAAVCDGCRGLPGPSRTGCRRRLRAGHGRDRRPQPARGRRALPPKGGGARCRLRRADAHPHRRAAPGGRGLPCRPWMPPAALAAGPLRGRWALVPGPRYPPRPGGNPGPRRVRCGRLPLPQHGGQSR